MTEPVPETFRPDVEAIVARLAAGDFEGVWTDHLALGTGDLGAWIRDYPATLTSLPDEAWQLSDAIPLENDPGSWAATVPLWTEQEGRSDLTLTATLRAGQIPSIVDLDVHVL